MYQKLCAQLLATHCVVHPLKSWQGLMSAMTQHAYVSWPLCVCPVLTSLAAPSHTDSGLCHGTALTEETPQTGRKQTCKCLCTRTIFWHLLESGAAA